MKVAVIGTGYVGLVAGACFADAGNTVICVDKDPAKLKALKNGEIPIYEPGLDLIVERSIKEGRLSFTESTHDAVQACEIIFFAVGTPPLPNGEPDLSYLKSAAEEAAKAINGHKIFVNKSTVPIGTHKTVADWMKPLTQHSFDVVSNPEFLKEGSAIDDFLKPDRVVVGTHSEAAYQKMAELYAPFVRQGNPVIWMDPVSAEMTKYACNSFLAVRISFMNELSQLCEKLGGNIESIRKGMATDVRIGRHFLYAGVGYGGSCFPKDIQALLSTGKKANTPLQIVQAAEDANYRQKSVLISKVKKHFGEDLTGKTFALWGLAFKPNTDDMREAPSLTIIDGLLKAGAKVRAFDPVAMENTKRMIENKITYTQNAYEAVQGCDALLIVTEWNEFRAVEFDRVKTALKQPLIFDGRNIFEPSKMRSAGFTYHSIGRP